MILCFLHKSFKLVPEHVVLIGRVWYGKEMSSLQKKIHHF